MAHLTLYRKYRPRNWDDVIAQDHIVRTLRNQIERGTVGHAYLFTGTRGTGKTSSAKIFAQAVNCLNPINGSPCGKCEACRILSNPVNPDVIEMDAASNNGVDEIRELKENVQYPPSVGKYKVYIIDEVHMLSGAAFNALLKTLEEPPEHAIFILATTEVHKLPQTILSRCMRFDFRLVPKNELIILLKKIFKDSGYKYDDAACELLAQHGEGSVRDMLSLAEMCMSYSPDGLTGKDVLDVLGASDSDTLNSIAEAVLSGNLKTLLSEINSVYDRGKGITTLNRELSGYFRTLAAVKNIPGYTAGLSADEYNKAYATASGYDNYRIGRILNILANTENAVRYSTQGKTVFEAALIKAAETYTDASVDGLISRLRALESNVHDMMANGVISTVEAPKNTNFAAETVNNAISKLTEEAIEIDETPVFPDTVIKKSDREAEKLWGSLLTELRESGENFIYFALKNVPPENLTLDRTTGKLNAELSERATIIMLESGDNADATDAALKKISGGAYSFAFTVSKSERESVAKDKTTLKDLFGEKFNDKSRK